MKLKLMSLLFVFLATGCAGPSYVPYYLQGEHLDTANNSEALAVARAAGILGGLKDNELNAEIAKMRSSVETSVDNTLALASSTTGFSLPVALVAGTAIAAVTSDDSAQGNKFLAWMPVELAASTKEAGAVFHNMILAAFEEAAEELSWEVGYIFREGGFVNVISEAYVQSADLGCEGRACRIKFVVDSPFEQLMSPPAFTGLTEGYLFAGQRQTAEIELDIKTTDPRIKMALFQSISKRLPEWVYLYAGPDGVFHPYMVNQGKLMYFDKPDGAVVGVE